MCLWLQLETITAGDANSNWIPLTLIGNPNPLNCLFCLLHPCPSPFSPSPPSFSSWSRLKKPPAQAFGEARKKWKQGKRKGLVERKKVSNSPPSTGTTITTTTTTTTTTSDTTTTIRSSTETGHITLTLYCLPRQINTHRYPWNYAPSL